MKSETQLYIDELVEKVLYLPIKVIRLFKGDIWLNGPEKTGQVGVRPVNWGWINRN